MDSDFLSDITLEILHIDSVCQYYAIFCGDVLLVPFPSQFRQDGRTLVVFDVPKCNDLHIRVDGKVILEHVHSLIVFSLNLRDVIIAVGECSQGIIFLCVHAKPDAVSVFLLCKGCRALKNTVFICRESMFLDLLAVAVQGCHSKGHARHALLAVSIDLADREIATHDLVFNGVFFLRQVNSDTVLPDDERYWCGTLDRVSLRCCCLDNLVVAVGECTVPCLGEPCLVCRNSQGSFSCRNLLSICVNCISALVVNGKNSAFQSRAAQRLIFSCLQISFFDLYPTENGIVSGMDLDGLCQCIDINAVNRRIRQVSLRHLCLLHVVSLTAEDLNDVGCPVRLYREVSDGILT